MKFDNILLLESDSFSSVSRDYFNSNRFTAWQTSAICGE